MSKGLRARLMNERGSIFLGALMFVAVMTLLGLALFDLTVVESSLAVDQKANVQAVYAAEAGMNDAWFEMATTGGGNDYTDVVGGAFSTTTPIAFSIPTDLPAQMGSYSYSASYIVTKCNTATECVPTDKRFPAPSNGFWVKSVGTAAATSGAPTGRQAKVYARFTNSLGPTLQYAVETYSGISISGGGAYLTDSFNSENGQYNIGPDGLPDTADDVNWGSDGDVKVRNGDISMQGTAYGDAWASGTIAIDNEVGGSPNPGQPPGPNFTGVGDCSNNGTAYYSGSLTGPGVNYDPATGDLTVSGGSATLTLPPLPGGAAYCFNTVKLQGGASLIIPSDATSPVIIKLTGKLTQSGGSITNMTFNPKLLQIGSCVGEGTGACEDIATGVDISGNSEMYGVLYAPYTTVKCHPCSIAGAVVAKQFDASGGSTHVHFDEALRNGGVVFGPQTYTRDRWVLAQN